MEFNWYKIFNLADLPEEIDSRTYRVNLAGIGTIDLLVNRGIKLSLTYDGVLLPLFFEDKNPFIGLGNQYAVYQDADENIYFGIAAEE